MIGLTYLHLRKLVHSANSLTRFLVSLFARVSEPKILLLMGKLTSYQYIGREKVGLQGSEQFNMKCELRRAIATKSCRVAGVKNF